MTTNNKKENKKLIYRLIRWLRKSFDFLVPFRIDVDLGKK